MKKILLAIFISLLITSNGYCGKIVEVDPNDPIVPYRCIRVFMGDSNSYIEQDEYCVNCDISLLQGIVSDKYWKKSGDFMVEMTQPEKDALDADAQSKIDAATESRIMANNLTSKEMMSAIDANNVINGGTGTLTSKDFRDQARKDEGLAPGAKAPVIKTTDTVLIDNEPEPIS